MRLWRDNPIGLVVTALGALAVAIGAVVLKGKEETEQEDERIVKFRGRTGKKDRLILIR